MWTTDWMQLGVAFSLGIVGSMHCALMCGPIALITANGRTGKSLKYWSRSGAYNLGRIFTYVLLGMLAGSVGQTAYFFGFQQYFSIAVGVFIIVGLVIRYLGKRASATAKWYQGLVLQLLQRLQPLVKNDRLISKWLLGMANGLLPCGLVYMALSGSTVQYSAYQGGLFMLVFGLGTVPVMITLPLLKTLTKPQFGLFVRKKLTPLLFLIMATLMIVRGLNLGIPYMSPFVNPDSPSKVSCH